MPKKYKTTSLYNVRIGNDKLREIKKIAIKEDKTLNQVMDRLIDLGIQSFNKLGTIF